MKLVSHRSLIVFLVLVGSIVPQARAQAQTEVCPTYNFSQLFYTDYYPGTRWDNRSGDLNITWSANNVSILNDPVVRPFSPEELSWIRDAFQSWDDALETVKFTEVNSPTQAAITIGYVTSTSVPDQPSAIGQWQSWWQNNWRHTAVIKLKVSESWWFGVKSQFTHAVQHELGNVLGLGDVMPSDQFTSTQEDYWQPPYGNIPLSDFDTGMIRQLYGESTCPSTFPSNIKAASELKAKQEADALAAAAKAKADEEFNAKKVADALAAIKAAPSPPSISAVSSVKGTALLILKTPAMPGTGGPVTKYQYLLNGKWIIAIFNSKHQLTIKNLKSGVSQVFYIQAISAGGTSMSNAVKLKIK